MKAMKRRAGEQQAGLDDLHPGGRGHAAEQHIDHHQRADDDDRDPVFEAEQQLDQLPRADHAKDLQSVLFHCAIYASGAAGTEKHYRGKMIARENAHDDGKLERAHSNGDLVELGRRPETIQLVQNNGAVIFLEILNERIVLR